MHYFIDGYNLIFRMMRPVDKLQVNREFVIKDLNKKIKTIDLDVTLVFDSQYQHGEESRSHFNHLEIVFTAQGETADDFILSELKRAKEPSQHIVVTSDKRLALRARHYAKTEDVKEFVAWLDKRYQNKLREQKPNTEKQEVKAKTKPASSSPRKPAADVKTEECFEYYLMHFEQSLASILQQKKENKEKTAKKPSTKKRLARKKEDEKNSISDMERWLKIFEEKKGLGA